MAVTSREKSSARSTGELSGPTSSAPASGAAVVNNGFVISKTTGHFVHRIRLTDALPNLFSS